MIPIEIPGEDSAVYEVIGGSARQLKALIELYKEFFPQYPQYLPRIRYKAQLPADADPRFVEHWWLVEIDGQPAGFRMFKYALERNCGLSLGLAIRPSYRRLRSGRYRRLAELLLMSSLEQLKADAQVAGRPIPAGMVTELQLPETTTDEALQRGRARLIARYREYGFVELPVEYYEPPFIQGGAGFEDLAELEKKEFLRLLLGIFPIEGGPFDPSDPAMVTDLVLAFLVDHYGLPGGHWAVRRTLDSMRQHYEEEVGN